MGRAAPLQERSWGLTLTILMLQSGAEVSYLLVLPPSWCQVGSGSSCQCYPGYYWEKSWSWLWAISYTALFSLRLGRCGSSAPQWFLLTSGEVGEGMGEWNADWIHLILPCWCWVWVQVQFLTWVPVDTKPVCEAVVVVKDTGDKLPCIALLSLLAAGNLTCLRILLALP